MSLTGRVSLKLHDVEHVSQTLQLFHEAGWEFGGDPVRFEHYRATKDMGNWQYASSTEWPELLRKLDQLCDEGEQVCVWLSWHDTGPLVEFAYSSPNGIDLYFDGSHPMLPDCAPFTDYRWVLSRTLQPLRQAGIAVLEATCNDSWY